jgi:hypothetical protein
MKFTTETTQLLVFFSSEHNTRAKVLKLQISLSLHLLKDMSRVIIKRGVKLASFLNLIMNELKQEYLMRHKKESRSTGQGTTRQDWAPFPEN